MRIGMPTTSFPRHARDAAGRFVLELGARLAELGHEVEVLAPEPSEALPLPALPRGVHLTWLPYVRPRALERTFYRAGAPENLGRDLLAWPGAATHPIALTAALVRAMPRWDAVISHWALPSGIATELAMRLGARRPHVCVVHSGDAHLLARLPARSHLAAVLASGARLVASSRATAGVLRSAFAVPPAIEVVPMGTDEPRVSDAEHRSARERTGVDPARLLLVSLARLVPIKRVDLSIDAARASDAALVVAGEGPLQGVLRSRARGAEVRFVGQIGPCERRRWLAASDALVLASAPTASGRTEGTPVSVLEALGAGLPVVASATGGVPDVVRHEVNGLLVTPGDGAALERAVARLAHDAALRAALRGGARATEVPTMRATAGRLAALCGA